MSASSRTKKSQGTLVDEALQQYGDTSSLELIDIGINLADPSFDEVRCCKKASLIKTYAACPSIHHCTTPRSLACDLTDTCTPE